MDRFLCGKLSDLQLSLFSGFYQFLTGIVCCTSQRQVKCRFVGREDVIVTIIGLASAVVDNVPLVAASMGMYSMAHYPTDSFLWEFMAYAAGTGGLILIIGSAAGIAAMGLEKINFLWYVKRISGLALIGYFVGIAVFIVQYRIFH